MWRKTPRTRTGGGGFRGSWKHLSPVAVGCGYRAVSENLIHNAWARVDAKGSFFHTSYTNECI